MQSYVQLLSVLFYLFQIIEESHNQDRPITGPVSIMGLCGKSKQVHIARLKINKNQIKSIYFLSHKLYKHTIIRKLNEIKDFPPLFNFDFSVISVIMNNDYDG